MTGNCELLCALAHTWQALCLIINRYKKSADNTGTPSAGWSPRMKVLRFNEAGLDCNFEVHGNTVEEVLKKASDHARKGHDLEVTEDSLAAWRSLIQEE
jgi:predicted small metal-binding protein